MGAGILHFFLRRKGRAANAGRTSDERARRASALEIALRASDLPPRERRKFVRTQVGGDRELARATDRLLAGSESISNEQPEPQGSPELIDALDRIVRATHVEDQPPSSPAGPPEFPGLHVVRELGGGLGSNVYLARQDQPPRDVALKVLRPRGGSATAAERFALEVAALGRMQHPHIAQIFSAEVRLSAGRYESYFTMEFVEGLPVTSYVVENCLGDRERLELLAKIAEAVDYAHGQGVVHRDLKPANILVDGSGTPKLLDFGIAGVREPMDSSGSVIDDQLTSQGELLGTFGFMSPEQVLGLPTRTECRVDVYALGLVAYEVLAGRPAIDLSGLGLEAALDAIRRQYPKPLGHVVPRWRGGVERVVHKALCKDPRGRYSTAAEFAEDLNRCARNEPVAASLKWRYRIAASLTRRRNQVALGAAIGLVAAALLFARWNRVGRSTEEKLAAFVESIDEDLIDSGWDGRSATDALLASRSRMARYGLVELDERIRGDHVIAIRLSRNGSFLEAVDLLEASLGELEGASDVQPGVGLESAVLLGTLLVNLGMKLDTAEYYLARAVQEAESLGTDFESLRYRALEPRLRGIAERGGALEAERGLRGIVEELRGQSDYYRQYLLTERAVTRVLLMQGLVEEAVEFAHRAHLEAESDELAPARQAAGLRFDYAMALAHQVAEERGSAESREDSLRSVLTIFRSSWGERVERLGWSHPWTLNARAWLGYAMGLAGEPSRARGHLSAAVQGLEDQGLADSRDARLARERLREIGLSPSGETR